MHLREDKALSVSTIKGYRSMLSSVFRHLDLDITGSQDLHDIVRSFSIQVPRRTVQAPSWDLDLVLKALCGAPYEPLGLADFRALTKKTLFLVALATAKRVSELHAVHRWVSFNRAGHAVLGFLPEFLAKTESSANPLPREYVLKNLSDLVGREDEERRMCPVRALKFYMEATKEVLPRPRSLFVSVRDKTRPLSKNAISFFLRETIQQAIQPEGAPAPAGVRAHSIRGLATSLNFWKNRSLAAVLEAATWKANTVFVSHYLKDVQRTYEQCHSLGPIVAAGAVV